MKVKYSVLLFLTLCLAIEAAKILGVYPTPSFSHQEVFRPLMLELARRGHEVTVITTHPIFQKAQAPENYIEIDVQKTSKTWANISVWSVSNKDIYYDMKARTKLVTDIFYEQLRIDEVRKIIDNKNIEFDLIIIESWVRATLGFAHRFKVPVIKFGSFGGVFNEYDIIGSADHPVLYFSPFLLTKMQNLSFWNQISVLYNRWSFLSMHKSLENDENEVLRSHFGCDMPSLTELSGKTSAMMLNIHRVWEMYRPSPLNLITVGGIHIQPEKEMPKDLKSYLDSSIHGVIYVSFGSRYDTSLLPSKQVEAMVNVLSRLPYDVLWKCSNNKLPVSSKNIKISKWLPQQEILRHPNIKLFVTQGGQQSTHEAIAFGVPLFVIPLGVDQYYNAEHVIRLNIGVQLHMPAVTEQNFEDKIYKLIKDGRYRDNIFQLRSLLYDTPQSPLQRAVWWTEYVLRHGAQHVRAPAHNMHWTEYLEIELFATVFVSVSLLLILIAIVIFKASCFIWENCMNSRTIKRYEM